MYIFFKMNKKLLTDLQMIKIAQLSRLLNVRKSVSRRNGILYLTMNSVKIERHFEIKLITK